MYTVVVAAVLIFSNVSLFVILVNYLKPGHRRLCSLDHSHCMRPGSANVDRPTTWICARSLLAQPIGRPATLKALKKLKTCLCTSAKEEQLPLFQIHCTDFKKSIDAARAQVQNQLMQPKVMSKMHSWPPMQQGIERPMSDLEPVFSMPMLPRILCPVPEREPLAQDAPLAKGGAMIGAADMEIGRQAEELRRVLRSMYKTHFQMQTEVRYDNARGPFAEQSLHCVTPTADDLKAELLAHGRKPPSSRPPRHARSAERAASAGAELAIAFAGAEILKQQAAHCPAAFRQSLSCPPEFWGEEKGQELRADRPVKSMDFLLDTLLDMSVAALVSSSPSQGSRGPVPAATPEGPPTTLRSPFDLPSIFSVHAQGVPPMGSMHEVML